MLLRNPEFTRVPGALHFVKPRRGAGFEGYPGRGFWGAAGRLFNPTQHSQNKRVKAMPMRDSRIITARVKNEDYRKFKAEADRLGITSNAMMNRVIRVIGNGFKPVPFEYKELLKACDRCGLPYQKAIDVATRAVDEAAKIKREEIWGKKEKKKKHKTPNTEAKS